MSGENEGVTAIHLGLGAEGWQRCLGDQCIWSFELGGEGVQVQREQHGEVREGGDVSSPSP